ncbi:winged helix-turn-helix domain-containing protein [Shewanella sp. OMA3-2]|uniref:winged helix-turn-helix domain-containing protein n=1 Tax=Shewanella sp. OMA3-2 TaxID=2908650 RepID=UPI001F34C8B5|nr:winged helix-turn-helix domain-containing protein [Shewanella sp. OMA3-2]UJF22816.1 winged helix-turn-helix domain-containing protein [Shewanella sp. OMA3-2]
MRFVFGNITVDLEKVEIVKNNVCLVCEPRVFELLVFFCNHPQEAISREELITQVWGGRIVSDAAVNRAIGELRKLIEDMPSSPTWVKTVSKVGYIFTARPSLLTSPNLSDAENTKTDSNNQARILPQPKATDIKIHKSGTLLTAFNPTVLSIVIAILFIIVGVTFYQSSQSSIQKPLLKILDRQPKTALQGSAFNPSFDPQTQGLVFLYRASADDYAQLFMQQADNPPIAMTNDTYYYTDVIYAADGFIYASRLNNLQQRQCEIVKLNPASKQLEIILDCGQRVVTQLGFDIQSKRLIYQYRPSISEPYAIYAYQLDTGRKQQLTHPQQIGNNLGDYSFSLSAKNQTLAVVEYRDNGLDSLKLLNINDNNIIANVPFIDGVYGLQWLTEHQLLASNSEGLFEFDINTSILTTVEKSDQFGRLASGDDSHSIITERSQTRMNIFSYSLQDSSSIALTASSWISQQPILGNKSNILAFKSNRTGKEKVYIQPENQAAYTAEFNHDIEHISAMAWSADDQDLIASINNRLYRYSVKNRNWQLLAQQFSKVHHVAYSQQSILFSAEVDNQWNIWQLWPETGKATQLTTKGGYSAQSNGQLLYFTKFNHPRLYQLDLHTGSETRLINDFPIAGWRHWQLRDDDIYYLLDKEYRKLSVNNSETLTLFEFPGRMPNHCNTAYRHDFFACDQIELSHSNIWQLLLSDS